MRVGRLLRGHPPPNVLCAVPQQVVTPAASLPVQGQRACPEALGQGPRAKSHGLALLSLQTLLFSGSAEGEPLRSPSQTRHAKAMLKQSFHVTSGRRERLLCLQKVPRQSSSLSPLSSQTWVLLGQRSHLSFTAMGLQEGRGCLSTALFCNFFTVQHPLCHRKRQLPARSRLWPGSNPACL